MWRVTSPTQLVKCIIRHQGSQAALHMLGDTDLPLGSVPQVVLDILCTYLHVAGKLQHRLTLALVQPCDCSSQARDELNTPFKAYWKRHVQSLSHMHLLRGDAHLHRWRQTRMNSLRDARRKFGQPRRVQASTAWQLVREARI